MAQPRRTAASAPGKVLLSGGYLVVDRAHTGLVFGLNARIHVVIEDAASAASDGDPAVLVVVRSPQFEAAEWCYECALDAAGQRLSMKQSPPTASKNPFVETALVYGLTYIHATLPPRFLRPLRISILADSAYYSHADTASPCASNGSSRFQNFNVRLTDAHKTGLGSSAALVTAFTGALLQHHLSAALHAVQHHSSLPPDANDRRYASLYQAVADWHRQTHNLAQAAHCTAQGKIGSGFDVAAAVYGPCLYRRFSPSILHPVSDPTAPTFADALREVVEDAGVPPRWDAEVNSVDVSMPERLRLLMCDVDCGSATPGMVKQVFAWRAAEPAVAATLWAGLEDGTQSLAAELRHLAARSPSDAELHTTQLAGILSQIRAGVRSMSRQADVPIEPPEQTALLDACTQQRGVVGGVVPGAGGYDALALVVENDDRVVEELRNFLESYRPPEGGQSKMGKVRLLDVQQDLEGLRAEEATLYTGWL